MDTVAVSAKTIDSVLGEYGWPAIVGMKIDVEGAEIDVLRGSSECLDRNPDAFVMVEVQGRMRLEGSLAVLHLLEDQPYRFRMFKRGAGSTVETIDSIAAELDGGHLFNVVAEKSAGGS